MTFLSDVYEAISPYAGTDNISKKIDAFLRDKVAQYSDPTPDSPWKAIIDKFILEPKWLDKSSKGHFAWDENQQLFYVLYVDRSNQGCELIK